MRQAVLSVIITTTIAGFLGGSVVTASAKTAKKTDSAKTKSSERTDVFFPPPPDEPRLQFLTAFASEKTFRTKKTHSFKAFITGQQEATKELSKPYGVTTYDHKIFICDTALGAVLVADLKEHKIGMLETRGEGTLRTPLNIAIDKVDGTAYIADSTRDQVIVFDKKGDYVDTIGKQGEMKPRDVAVGTDRVYVADVQSHNVRIYDKATRKYLSNLLTPAAATNEITGLFTPGNLTIDEQGRLYVSDTGAGHVQIYEGDGKHIRSIGQMGDGLGMFARLKGVAVDREHHVYAADAMSQVIQIFNDKGQLLTYFGDPGEGAHIQILPTKVAIDYEDVEYFKKYISPNFVVEHLVIVINQLGPHKVAVYGVGHKK
jgi:DNA-binding beta-propeller fold protein YncE